jgi:hypothetical protein
MSRIRTMMSRIRNTGKRCYQIRNRIKIGAGSETIIVGNLAPCILLFQTFKKVFFNPRAHFVSYHFSRRRTPHNFIFLGMFTLAEGFMLGCVTATYDVNEVRAKSPRQIFLSVIIGNMSFAGAGSGF